MAEFILVVGLPASGKSELGDRIKEEKNVEIVSSDSIREELFGDRKNQSDNKLVFRVMQERTLEYLAQGKDVLYDATNINSRRRKNLLECIPDDVYKRCIYMSAGKQGCINRDKQREYSVGVEVIDRMYKSLQIPMYHEGWDKIEVVPAYTRYEYDESLDIIFEQKVTYDEVLSFYDKIGIDVESVDIPQDNKHHSLSLLKHCYQTYVWLFDNYHEEDRNVMLLAGLLHDIGKVECKEFKDGSIYASYHNHDSISSQIAMGLMMYNGYDEDFAIQVGTIIQMHMRLSYNRDIKRDSALFDLVGSEMFEKLAKFRLADKKAK